VADALARAAAGSAPHAKTALRFTGQTLDTLAAADVAVFVACDAESRERDARLAAELDELRRTV
jgi:hypothetical protein